MRNYLSDMLYALTSAYSRKDYDNHRQGLPLETNIGKLFSILAWGLNSVEEQAELVLLWDDLDNAQGSVLDRYGENFGVKRNGSTDPFYRLLIKVKMISLLSGGDIDTVINATASLFDIDPALVDLDEVYPAKIRVYVDEDVLDATRIQTAESIASVMKRIVAAGVGMKLFLRSHRSYTQTVYINTGFAAHSRITARMPNVNRKATATLYTGTAAICLTAVTIKPAS